MSEVSEGTPPTQKRKRHRWHKINDYRKRCQDCDLLQDRRPHPYRRHWWTEWTLGQRNWNTLQGDKTPPCPPAE